MRSVTFSVGHDFSLLGFSIDIEFDLGLGNSMAKFLIHYTYPAEVFAGSLWLTPSSALTFPATLALTAEFEPYRVRPHRRRCH